MKRYTTASDRASQLAKLEWAALRKQGCVAEAEARSQQAGFFVPYLRRANERENKVK